jgi:26S proteasome regulatory subunit N12
MAEELLMTASELYKALEDSWNRKDMNTTGQLLSKLKLHLLSLSFLPTGSNESEMDSRPLLIGRSMLEIGAFWSLECGDVASFERYVAQLKSYYFDYAGILNESDYMYPILGLNLMRLLAQNKLADFHTELEVFPPEQLSNIYLKKPVTLEQFLMEGSYHKIFLSKEDIPSPYYALFINNLLDTIRDEIANCTEKAYQQISYSEAARFLMVNSEEEFGAYVNTRGWSFDPSRQLFTFAINDRKSDVNEIVKSPLLISQCLGYVRELEKIV